MASLLLLPATCIIDLLSPRDFAKSFGKLVVARETAVDTVDEMEGVGFLDNLWQSNLAVWEIPVCVYFECIEQENCPLPCKIT